VLVMSKAMLALMPCDFALNIVSRWTTADNDGDIAFFHGAVGAE